MASHTPEPDAALAPSRRQSGSVEVAACGGQAPPSGGGTPPLRARRATGEVGAEKEARTGAAEGGAVTEIGAGSGATREERSCERSMDGAGARGGRDAEWS